MSSAALKIKVFDNKGTHLVPISKSTATVGSAAHCDLVLDHASVQGEHVRVWCEGGRVWVQDLGGPTGTTLNGIRLPHLKPMLVRELDVLKLGECPATLGLEPNMMRAPVVKAVNLDEITLTDIKPLPPQIPVSVAPPVLAPITPTDPAIEVKKGELEKVSRDLAELKLQLQMTRLDKDSNEEMRKQLNTLQDEILKLKNEKERLQNSAEQIDLEKQKYKKQIDDEVATYKLKCLRDLKDQRDQDRKQFEDWKKEATAAIAQHMRQLFEIKIKSSRTFTREMIMEWHDDFDHCVRRVLMKPPLPSEDSGQVSAKSSTSTSAALEKERRAKKRHRSRSSGDMWNRVALVAFGLAFFMTALWMFSSYMKVGTSPRHVASRETAMDPQTQAANPARAAFAPAQSKGFKKSYTENILYTASYVDAELNADFRDLWLKELSRAARSDWKLSETALSAIAAKEIVLIQDLNRIRGTIVAADQARDGESRMKAREEQFLRELKEQLGKRSTVDRFMKLKRGFFTRNQVYLVRENR